MASFSSSLEQALRRALQYANQRSHEYATLEHLLLSLLDDRDAAAVMRACDVDIDLLRDKLTGYLDNELAGLVLDSHNDAQPTAGFQRVIHRAVEERLGPEAIHTGCRLGSFAQHEGGMVAHFFDRTGAHVKTARGDILIGADGIHSRVREMLFPDEGPPCWNGLMLWRGATDWPVFLTGRSMIIAGGLNAKAVIYPIAEGSSPASRLTNWAVLVRIGEENAHEALSGASFVSVGYGSTNRALGGLGVVGPTRMDYPGNIAAVRAVARYVGHLLAES